MCGVKVNTQCIHQLCSDPILLHYATLHFSSPIQTLLLLPLPLAILHPFLYSSPSLPPTPTLPNTNKSRIIKPLLSICVEDLQSAAYSVLNTLIGNCVHTYMA